MLAIAAASGGFASSCHLLKIVAVVSLGEGNTPLYDAPRSRRLLRARLQLKLKHQGNNPTGSFKDTGMTVAVTQARELRHASRRVRQHRKHRGESGSVRGARAISRVRSSCLKDRSAMRSSPRRSTTARRCWRSRETSTFACA